VLQFENVTAPEAHYRKYFEPYRELPVKVLEIGVGGHNSSDAGGESLRTWKHCFQRGRNGDDEPSVTE